MPEFCRRPKLNEGRDSAEGRDSEGEGLDFESRRSGSCRRPGFLEGRNSEGRRTYEVIGGTILSVFLDKSEEDTKITGKGEHPSLKARIPKAEGRDSAEGRNSAEGRIPAFDEGWNSERRMPKSKGRMPGFCRRPESCRRLEFDEGRNSEGRIPKSEGRGPEFRRPKDCILEG
eukprot:gene17630-biopygen12829